MRAFRRYVRAGALGSGLVLLGMIVPVGTSAGATAAKNPVATTTVPSPFAAPGGYKVVTTGPFDAPGGTQTQGVATCPGTEVPAGGGALLSPVGSNNIDLYASLNSSYPQRNFWVVDVNTVGGSHASFNVYVICINAANSYSVVTSPSASNPAGTVTVVTATCPTNRVLVGGGAFSTSSDIAVNINTNVPLSGLNTWRIAIANQSASSTTASAYAICRKQPKGYSAPFSIQNSPSGAETPGAVACPTGSVPLNGGELTGAVLSVHLNSSFPSGSDWLSFLNNGDGTSWPFEVFAVCAGT